jgi:alkylation response protein AidB-like acyl-CoA dehydrogenase
VSVRARFVDGAWSLSGSKILVVDGASAPVILVTADTGRGTTLFTVDAQGPGVVRHPVDTVDLTRRLCGLELLGAPGTCVGQVGEGSVIVERALEAGCLALALESVGIVERLLELTVAYAKERLQFGRPIGSFQAVKHALADVHVDLELARSAARSAAWALAEDSPDAGLQIAIAKAFCTEVASTAAAACLQAHGGIGFTWEHPVHLYLKRAKGNELLFGRPQAHRHDIARRIGLVPR